MAKEDTKDTPTPKLARGSHGPAIKIKITKFGSGKVSTGEHIAGQGDTMARHNEVLTVQQSVGEALEKRGFAEIQ